MIGNAWNLKPIVNTRRIHKRTSGDSASSDSRKPIRITSRWRTQVIFNSTKTLNFDYEPFFFFFFFASLSIVIPYYLIGSDTHSVILICQVLNYRSRSVLVVERDQSSRSLGEPLQAVVWSCVLRSIRFWIISKNY